MKYSSRQLAETLVDIISAWDGVECIVLNEAALGDTLDPYFALIFDVYYRGGIPNAEARKDFYGKAAAAFETSPSQAKDRFLVKGLPVRVEYKIIENVEAQVDIAANPESSMWTIHRTGTYTFYRLTTGEILWNRSNWIDGMREKLLALPNSFWLRLRSALESRMEHYVSDLGAAVAQEDNFHYLIASASFIKHACMVLFSINRCFEPSHRLYLSRIADLSKLPTEFSGRLESFLWNETKMPPERKFALAQLIAKSIMAL